MSQYFVIAGKEEGFRYSDATIYGCETEQDAEAMINAMRKSGFKIFIVTKEVRRVDDMEALA